MFQRIPSVAEAVLQVHNVANDRKVTQTAARKIVAKEIIKIATTTYPTHRPTYKNMNWKLKKKMKNYKKRVQEWGDLKSTKEMSWKEANAQPIYHYVEKKECVRVVMDDVEVKSEMETDNEKAEMTIKTVPLVPENIHTTNNGENSEEMKAIISATYGITLSEARDAFAITANSALFKQTYSEEDIPSVEAIRQWM